MASMTLPVSHSFTRLEGSQLALWRSIWVGLVTISIVMVVLAVPFYFDQLRMGHQEDAIPPNSLYLTQEQASALQEHGIDLSTYAGFLTVVESVRVVLCIGAGILIFRRKSDDKMVIFTSTLFVLLGAFAPPPSVMTEALSFAHADWQTPVLFFKALMYSLAIWFLFLFPDGRFLPKKLAWFPPLLFLSLQIPVLFPDSIFNPYHWHPALFVGHTLITSIAVQGAQFYRYRYHADAQQRQQTKLAIAGFVGGFVFLILIPFGVLLFAPSALPDALVKVLYKATYEISFTLSNVIFIAAITFSIMRYRLWDVDLVINRGLVYGALTAILGVIFLGSLFLLQQLFQAITGTMQSSLVAIISTLTVSTLFQPTRSRLQRFIDRRFYHLLIDLEGIKGKRRDISNPGALSGTTLGSYKVLEVLGRGGMGEVYKAYQESLKRDVAIKVLPRDLAEEEEFRARFEREARTVASLKHPNVVNVFDFGQMNGLYYMVMEYIEGEELSHIIKHTGRLPLELVRPIFQQLADALDYAHSQGLVHRDIKPANIMLRPVKSVGGGLEPQVVLMDFGLAKLRHAHTNLTQTGGVMGTLDYLAPEQIMAAREVDPRTDVYALGIVLYQMLTGQHPFPESSPPQMIFAHLYKPAPNVRELVPDLPENVAEVISKAMSKLKEDRFQSAGEMAASL